MYGVMFRWDNKVTTESGHAITKVFMFLDGAPVGIKHMGLRPELAYIFKTEGGTYDPDYEEKNKEELMNWLHKSISTVLHPTRSVISYQNGEIRKVFSL